MFKIIKDETATVEQLAQGFVEIENYLPELKKEHQIVYDRLVSLQQAAMSGKNQSAKIATAKSQLLDCETKKEACNRGLVQIRERIADQLPVEASAQIEALETEFQTLKDEESELYKDFFTACAKAIACREKIMGVSYTSSLQSETGVKVAAPKLEVAAYQHMEAEDSVFFCEQTEKARQGNGEFVPVKQRLDKITDELDTLRTMTADYNPESEVEKVLAHYR